ncbi:MAG: AMP-binding protein [Actinomycetota bacterium]
MPVVWSPSPAYVERANVTRLMRAHGIDGYEELLARSTADIAWFWDAVVRDLGLDFMEPYERVLDTTHGVPWTTWFVGGRTNLAERCVDTWAARTPDAPAVVWESEDEHVRTLTYRELRALTDRVAHGLRALGVRERDTVGIFLPMAPETVAAVMACAKVGAVFVPIFSGFGPDAVAARLADAGARVLITADGSLRKGRAVPMLETARRAAELAGCVERIVVWPRLDPDALAAGPSEVPWAGLLGTSTRRSTRSRWTASIRCSWATRAGRPAGRRAPCTCTPGSW